MHGVLGVGFILQVLKKKWAKDYVKSSTHNCYDKGYINVIVVVVLFFFVINNVVG